jgi:hypothetical protein
MAANDSVERQCRPGPRPGAVHQRAELQGSRALRRALHGGCTTPLVRAAATIIADRLVSENVLDARNLLHVRVDATERSTAVGVPRRRGAARRLHVHRRVRGRRVAAGRGLARRRRAGAAAAAGAYARAPTSDSHTRAAAICICVSNRMALL